MYEWISLFFLNLLNTYPFIAQWLAVKSSLLLKKKSVSCQNFLVLCITPLLATPAFTSLSFPSFVSHRKPYLDYGINNAFDTCFSLFFFIFFLQHDEKDVTMYQSVSKEEKKKCKKWLSKIRHISDYRISMRLF